MSSVAIVYRKDKLNKNRIAPVHFRIIKDRKICYISSGIMIPEVNWDSEKNKIKSKHTNSARLNLQLTTKFAVLQSEIIEKETFTKSLTSKQLRNKVYGNKPTNFFQIAKDVLDTYESEGKVGTHDKCKSIVTKLETYNKSKNLFFQDIDVDFLTKYEKYLRITLKNKTNTVHKDLKFIRRIFNEAINRDLIELQVSPFNKFKIKLEKTSRTFLTEDELKLIENLEMKEGSLIQCHRNMFVFACYAGGLRVSDVLKLKWGHLDGSYILISIKKTKEQLRLKIPDAGLQIINHLKSESNLAENYIFPVLENGLDENNARLFDNAINSATALINKNLKVITKRAKVEKSISFHISRHTWATRALRFGVPIEIVSKILGHANISQTLIYAKIVSSEMDKAMDLFNL
jgi:integrase/recombinase XerD